MKLNQLILGYITILLSCLLKKMLLFSSTLARLIFHRPHISTKQQGLCLTTHHANACQATLHYRHLSIGGPTREWQITERLRSWIYPLPLSLVTTVLHARRVIQRPHTPTSHLIRPLKKQCSTSQVPTTSFETIKSTQHWKAPGGLWDSSEYSAGTDCAASVLTYNTQCDTATKSTTVPTCQRSAWGASRLFPNKNKDLSDQITNSLLNTSQRCFAAPWSKSFIDSPDAAGVEGKTEKTP